MDCTKNYHHCSECGRKISEEELNQNANDGYSNCCNENIASYPIAEYMGECYHSPDADEEGDW